MNFLVVIPALNAEKSLGQIVRGARAFTRNVVVVDDGSSDRTGDVAREAGAKVIRHEVNRGKGSALKAGFAYSIEQGLGGVVTLDADGQHLPSEIPKLLAAHESTGADLIIGGRSHLFEHMLPRRRMANRFSAATIAWASGTGVTDSQSGFRFYSAPLIKAVSPKSDGFDFESEIIVRAGRGGFRVVVVPIDLGFVDGEMTSHYKPLSDTLRIAWTVFKARFIWT